MSISSGEKIASDLQAHQTAYSQDQARAESEPDPGRDIELELCALDLEDSDQQEISQESLDMATSQSQDASHLLPPPRSPLLTSPVEEHPQIEGPLTEKMDPHLLKKMAFR